MTDNLKERVGIALIRLGWRLYMGRSYKSKSVVACEIGNGRITYSIDLIYKR